MARKIEQAERASAAARMNSQARELSCRERLLTVPDAANLLRLSPSWLAKARMRGDGPPYVKLGRSVRYPETGIIQWMRSRQRFSTSDW